MSGEVWYRYEDRRYAEPVDEWGDSYGTGRLEVNLIKIPVRKHTPKGVWLGWSAPGRFVLTSARKRYACPTAEEAKESFIARKKRQASIYRARLRDAEEAIRLAQKQGILA